MLTLCRTLLTNDSGAMHLAAAALGISVTALFGPTDERATRPLGESTRVLTHAGLVPARACCANARSIIVHARHRCRRRSRRAEKL